jgi:hypothetical protein
MYNHLIRRTDAAQVSVNSEAVSELGPDDVERVFFLAHDSREADLFTALAVLANEDNAALVSMKKLSLALGFRVDSALERLCDAGIIRYSLASAARSS